jgi:hypothetical protein
MFFFKNPVLCEQDSKKKNFEEENVQLSKDKQKPSIQRGGPSFDVDKTKGSKKKVRHQSLGRENLVGRGRELGVTE